MKSTFSGWREGMRFYAPPLALGIIILGLWYFGFASWRLHFQGPAVDTESNTYFVVATIWIAPILGILFSGAGGFALYFFRDPERKIPTETDAVVSPADGTIVGIEDLDSTPHYDGKCRRVSIFLSIFNVHVNRSPFAGTVTAITYKPGQFKNAMLAETTDCNEANAVRMQTERGPVTVRQVSGLIARRILCLCDVGDQLDKGQRFGMIRFGSRTELYLPPGTEICVTLKQKVKGGATVMARLGRG